jgi:hypothetical protein
MARVVRPRRFDLPRLEANPGPAFFKAFFDLIESLSDAKTGLKMLYRVRAASQFGRVPLKEVGFRFTLPRSQTNHSPPLQVSRIGVRRSVCGYFPSNIRYRYINK